MPSYSSGDRYELLISFFCIQYCHPNPSVVKNLQKVKNYLLLVLFTGILYKFAKLARNVYFGFMKLVMSCAS